MDNKPQSRSPSFKAKVAIEALKGEISLNEIALKYNVHPKQIARWRDQLIEESAGLFVHKGTAKKQNRGPESDDLIKKVGQLTIEIDYLKKKLGR